MHPWNEQPEPMDGKTGCIAAIAIGLLLFLVLISGVLKRG